MGEQRQGDFILLKTEKRATYVLFMVLQLLIFLLLRHWLLQNMDQDPSKTCFIIKFSSLIGYK